MQKPDRIVRNLQSNKKALDTVSENKEDSAAFLLLFYDVDTVIKEWKKTHITEHRLIGIKNFEVIVEEVDIVETISL